ncbi:MAG: HAD family hydrolase [Candidatus Hodarchaeota archaeon]
MINNIIFDLGNVLFNWDPENFLLRFTNKKQKVKWFLDNIIHSREWLGLDKGLLNLKEAESKFLFSYPKEKALISSFFKHWMEILTPISKNVLISKDLKENGYKIYILSNFIKEAFDFINFRNEFLSLFDGKIISGFEKVAKPDIEIYNLLINRYSLMPEECVFIDDVKPFLRPAKKLGMITIWHYPTIELREELKKLSIRF